jgi:hypothetical protein
MRRTHLLTAALGAILLSSTTAGVAGTADRNPGTLLAQA